MLTRFLAGDIHQDAPASNGFFTCLFLHGQQSDSRRRKNAKARIQKMLMTMFKLEENKTENGEANYLLLGSHSIQKYAATFARRCGVTKDKKDKRGQWKGAGRVSDVYDDVE
jgi:hypothetical protein